MREAMRVSAAATLASAPPLSASPLASDAVELRYLAGREVRHVVDQDASRFVCLEVLDGKKWKYVAVEEGSGKLRTGTSVRAVPLQHSPLAPVDVSSHDN